MRHTYEVVVGNVGTVYRGSNKRDAMRHYTGNVDNSKSEGMRATGEPVVLMRDDEIVAEHVGTLEQD